MKSKNLIIVLFAVGLIIFSMPANAIHFTASLNADCEYFEITVEGKTWVPYTANYSVTFDGSGSAIEGSFDLIPNELNQVSVTYKGGWVTPPCGAVTVSGSYEILSERDIDPVFTGDFLPVSLDCPCVPCDCEGKVAQLTLRYRGSNAALIEVKQKKPFDTVFSGNVQTGETFTFHGTDKHGTLGTEIYLFVDGRFNASIHTSCSQPIGPGMVRGDFEVVEGIDRQGNPLCPVEDCDACKRTSRQYKYKCKKGKKNGYENKKMFNWHAAKGTVLVPGEVDLMQNSPNPFNPVTTISFMLPKSGNVKLTVFNSVGKKIDTIIDGYLEAGTHSTEWNASDNASGIYFYMLNFGNSQMTRRMLYLK